MEFMNRLSADVAASRHRATARCDERRICAHERRCSSVSPETCRPKFLAAESTWRNLVALLITKLKVLHRRRGRAGSRID